MKFTNLDVLIAGNHNNLKVKVVSYHIMSNTKQKIEEAQVLTIPENQNEILVSVAVLKDNNDVKSILIEYNPNYISETGMISYEWTKQELQDLIAKLD